MLVTLLFEVQISNVVPLLAMPEVIIMGIYYTFPQPPAVLYHIMHIVIPYSTLPAAHLTLLLDTITLVSSSSLLFTAAQQIADDSKPDSGNIQRDSGNIHST
jgi:hypothetical protein